MSSDSELTEFEDDEEVYTRSKASKGKTKANGDSDSGYRIRGALKVPRATTYTCQSLYEQIHAQDVDLQPDYQRAVVWPDNKQVGLIDSIFRNFYVPPVIFVVHFSDDGGERRVCVDGKQRLTSIYRFIGGEIPYKDPFTGEKFVFKDTGKIKAKLLPERYRKLFMNKQIVCMEYQDITPANEREIFQRVQLGMALTPAEKLQAITGPQADFVRELLDNYVVDKLAADISWDVSRANDFRVLATAVYSISRWPHLTSMPTLNVIESWLQEPDDLDDEFCQDIHDTFRIFCALAKDVKLNKVFWLPGVKKVAPMEVLAIAVLIHANKKKMSMAQLSEAIGLMRKDIRKTEKDIRQNSRMFKLVLTFLKELRPSMLTAESGTPAARQQRTGKRKRTTKSPSSSSDEDAPPAKKSTPKSKPKSTAPPPTSAPPSTSAHVVPSSGTIRIPPTGPSAMRVPANANLPPRPGLPTPPTFSQRQNSLGENLMARMNTSSQAVPRPVPGASSQSHVNDYQSNRAFQNPPSGPGQWHGR
ncbi:hypothetical protein L226DRAFT_541090 [Lentinus tigrinus ALCF2SS1-7]|uniref:GmrSD restriction endonucleases N-terminal domain-containing protein n=1 Tax=Lentinus tigrinus ALCF2SS1-6 TaxID=1328759 RepID=A0A5C2RN49_9APHY|nr:hypothetical protein L227DRAFT_582045 [Lentinus tigrinus ALCF2SS1-6]RPD67966.1 hypothetical protein L226DRAFT_541090 [Lentinus tigrinus ALCF2SS1-7]